MSGGFLAVAMFSALAITLALGLPLSFTLGGIAMVFTTYLWGFEGLYIVAVRTFSVMSQIILIAVPLFIFMACVLEKSKVTEALYETFYKLMAGLKGGLAMGTVMICTIMAAMVGISGAATVTMGLIALPSMMSRGYDKNISVGCIAAGGALGVLIPPSVLMIAYGLVTGVSIGQLFAGGVFAGLLLSSLFVVYIGVRCFFQPHLGPSLPPEERASWGEKFVSLRGVILPILLIVAVLGSIFGGICTPTEAAAIGALGSLGCAAVKRKLTWQMIKEVSKRTFLLNGMISWIIIGAMCFTAVYIATGGAQVVEDTIKGLEVNRWVILIGMQLTFFILGMFLDPGGIIFICAPIYCPIAVALGFDPLWYGILFVVNMEMGYLTPPFGYNLFYLKSIVPEGVSMGDIYRSIIPFVFLQAIGLTLIIIFPQIALWLPGIIFSQ